MAVVLAGTFILPVEKRPGLASAVVSAGGGGQGSVGRGKVVIREKPERRGNRYLHEPIPFAP